MERTIKKIIFAARNTVACTSEKANIDPPANGALVETRYSCISAGTELAKLTGKQSFPYPAGIGNRAIGRVIAAGSACSRVKSGDLVFAHAAHASVAATDGLVVRLPDELDQPETALIGMASVAMTGVRVARPEIGDRAVVLGAGPVGQLAAQLLALDGARVIMIDPVKERLGVARRCGILHVIDSSEGDAAERVLDLTDGEGAEHILDCTGLQSVIVSAPPMARKGGQIVLVGSPRGEYQTDVTDFLNAFHLDRAHGDLTLRGAHEWKIPIYPVAGLKHSQERNVQTIVQLICEKRLKLSPLLSKTFSPDDAQAAYDALAQSPSAILGAVFDWSGISGSV
ncbi:MAG: zinc-binding alcohol dehydrogenase [Capsulimonadaceae bacterium]|nr:zinc-binding alcohol dehydrogenase [Capsulimonadaceae bacterium]